VIIHLIKEVHVALFCQLLVTRIHLHKHNGLNTNNEAWINKHNGSNTNYEAWINNHNGSNINNETWINKHNGCIMNK
jgi:hypothetical protein